MVKEMERELATGKTCHLRQNDSQQERVLRQGEIISVSCKFHLIQPHNRQNRHDTVFG